MKNFQLKNYSLSRYDLPAMLARLDEYYTAYYDKREGAAFATGEGADRLELMERWNFHVQESSFVLLERAKMWEYTSHEFAFIFSAEHLTAEAVQKAIEFAYDEGMEQFTPASGHKCTVISAVFLCETADAEAEKAVRRCRRYKSFHFSLYGWMNFHTVLLERRADRILTNSAGRDKAKTMKYIFPRSGTGSKKVKK